MGWVFWLREVGEGILYLLFIKPRKAKEAVLSAIGMEITEREAMKQSQPRGEK